MDKELCLELVKLSSTMPPVYKHPYHKHIIPKPRVHLKSVYVTISKVHNFNKKYNKSYHLDESLCRTNLVSIHSPITKHRPLTSITSSIYLDNDLHMFTPIAKARRVRTNSVC
jgi:hypothetical protein